MSIQDFLADYVDEQAAWRDSKAAEYPEDERNARCAEGLRELADYIRRLDPNDSILSRVDESHDDAGTGTFMPGEVTAGLISRFRFNIPNETPRGLLERIPRALEDDRINLAADQPVRETKGSRMTTIEKEDIVARLRKSRADEEQEEYEAGRHIGEQWAKRYASLSELESVAENAAENWISWTIGESNSLANALETNEETLERFGYRLRFVGNIHVESTPMFRGVVDGAMMVYEQVADQI